MTQMVTRCPKCATAFRITSTQLESAKGAVRCGSCLHIFKAQEYLVKSAEEEKAVALKPIKPEQTKPAQPKVEAPKPQASTSEPSKPAAPIAKKPVVAVAAVKPSVQPSLAPSASANKPVAASLSKPEKVVEAKPVIDKAKVLADEDDVLISDDMDNVLEKKQSTYEFDGFIDLDLHPKQTVSLFEREIRYEPPTEDDDEETTDESWAEELLDDDGEPLQQFKKPVAQPAPVVQAVIEVPAEPEQVKSHAPIETESNNKYSGPVFSLVSETTATHESNTETRDEPFFSEAFLNATRAPEPVVESTNFAAALFEQEPDNSDSDDAEKASKRPVKSSSKMRAFDTSRAALLMNIMPAPVEFTARRMRRWYQKKLWPSLAIIMCILFFFQIAYFKFDYFSRVEPYRTAYLFVCPVFRCEVPSLVDTSQILATNLIVRNHPEIPSALMVDAILINNAPFEQPFPDLILSFSKLDETPVATRRFTPKEYLGGELAGKKYIPQRQPVHITLEIADPGPDAVNYTLATH